ncbi:OmpW/AlkL family protein [Paraburkholderia sp. HP33-1]|uniref:OmpW/AlkL family protein n=1 Tax=Paraburkholderia sp. HP33-1 TaxID=2883243 RepID=UPI001F2ED506|nr:OmpW family outer membrane protein [Paraburkholderia sp. HP33-1]
MKQTSAAVLLSLSAISLAHAQSAGQWMVNAGWMHMAPQDSSQPLTVNALGHTSTMEGTGASVADTDTFALTATYFVTDHIAIETILGVPPTLHLNGTGTLASLGELGNARSYSPALLAQYHFGEPSARLRPYVGAGVSYVWFNSVQLSAPLSSGQFLFSPATGTLLEGPTSASLSKSFAPIVNAGLTYNIDSHWSVGVSLSYVWLSSRATLTTHSAVGTVTTTAKLKIDPVTSFVSIGYRF